MKKFYKYAIVCILIIAVCITALIPLTIKKPNTRVFLIVRVITMKGDVLPDAIIAIEGVKDTFKTALNGETDKIEIEYLGDECFAVKLFVFKGGYVDTIIYNCMLYKEKDRLISVHMLVDDGSLSFIALSEVPRDDICENEIRTQKERMK